MNSRKRPYNNNNHNNSQNNEEITQSNMNIEEESIINEPPSDINKNSSSVSFNIAQERNILAFNIIQIPLNENLYNTQQRPNTSLSIYLEDDFGNADSFSNMNKNSEFTSKKRNV